MESQEIMLSREIQEYIEKMREEEYSSYDTIEPEDNGQMFIGQISENVAVFFNQIIYSINCLKNNNEHYQQLSEEFEISIKRSASKTPSKIDPINDHLQSNVQTTEKRVQECINQQQLDQIKDLEQIYSKQDKLNNQPKKPVSSFFMFYQERSKEFATQAGMGGSKLSQIIAETWRNLPSQEKKPYFDRVAADKKRYAEQISKYIQEHSNQLEDIKRINRIKKIKMKKMKCKTGQEDQDEMDSEQITTKIKGISQRQIKAANRKNYSHRPKAPVSSFFIFYKEEAGNIAQKYGQTVGSKLARLASSLWKGMSKQEKEKYEIAAKIERKRYHDQMAQYKIDYPNQIQSRRKKISISMKRALKDSHDMQKEQNEQNSQSDQNSNPQSNNNQQSQNTPNSYVSSASQGKKSAQTQKAKPISRRKQKQDPMPHKPKGPVCSFFQYYHAHMHQFMKKQSQNKKDAGSQFVCRASAKWKTLGQQQKQLYHQLAKADRQRYLKDIAHFKETYPKEYEAFELSNKQKQSKKKIKNEKKKAKLQKVNEQDIDDIDQE